MFALIGSNDPIQLCHDRVESRNTCCAIVRDPDDKASSVQRLSFNTIQSINHLHSWIEIFFADI